MSQVKFKIGFVMDSESLFGLIGKFLPVEDLSVEEIVERPPKLPLQAIAHAVNHITKRTTEKKTRASPGPNLKKGINGIIMTALADGPKRANQLKPKVKAAGFSENSVNSRLEALRGYGVLEMIGDGTWKKVG
jgi:hypothetical protein